MSATRWWLGALMFTLSACASTGPTGSSGPPKAGRPVPLVTDVSQAQAATGKRVQVQGTAKRAKLGDAIDAPGITVFCVDVRFPDDVLGKPVLVEGMLDQTKQFEATVGPEGEIGQGTEPGGEPLWILRDCTRL